MRDLTPFGEWLKRRRKALDLTREELAKRAHCSVSTVRRLEAADLRASKALAASLATALGIPPDQHDAFIQFARGDATQAALFSTAPGRVPTTVSASATVNHLPAPLTSLVGRRMEIAAVCELLRQPGVRLLTLSGPPGTGKTRLGVAVADKLSAEFADGVHFIPLAPLSDPSLVASAIAQAVGMRENGKGGIVPALKDFLHAKSLLLVLDNFEQLIAAAPLVTDLLSAALNVKALVTSREVLGVYGEHEFPVPPLALPDVNRLPSISVTQYLTRYTSVQLFRERARAVKPDFQLTSGNVADVARICAWLDGLPLAIEMAAAQTKWFAPNQLLEQLSNRLAALTGGPRDLTPRQQSLRGAIEWSYDLLADDERRLFEVLSVFVGGCDAQAVQKVMGAIEIGRLEIRDSISNLQSLTSNLHALTEKSLLQHELTSESESRYSMLESIREYARERLQASGQMERALAAHAAYYLGFAESAWPHLMRGGDQVTWFNRVEREHNNIRAALVWATENHERLELAQHMIAAMHPFWFGRGYLSEDRRWLERILRRNDAPTTMRARLLNHAGELARLQAEYERARLYCEQALAIARSLDDPVNIARSLQIMGQVAREERELMRAVQLFEEALVVRRECGDTSSIALTLVDLALAQLRLGNLERAAQLYSEALEIARKLDNLRLVGYALNGLALVRIESGDYAAALELLRQSVQLHRQFGQQPPLLNALQSFALIFYHRGDAEAAARLYCAHLKLRDELKIFVERPHLVEDEAILAKIRAQIGETAFARAWAEGERLSLDEAVALALRKE